MCSYSHGIGQQKILLFCYNMVFTSSSEINLPQRVKHCLIIILKFLSNGELKHGKRTTVYYQLLL